MVDGALCHENFVMWGQNYQVIGKCVVHEIINLPSDYTTNNAAHLLYDAD